MGKKTSSKKAGVEGKALPPAAQAPAVASASKRQRSTDDAAAPAGTTPKKVTPHAGTGGGGKGGDGKENGEEEELVFEDPFGDEFDPEDIDAMNAQEAGGDEGEDGEEEDDGMDAKESDRAMDAIPEGGAAAQQETKVWRAGVDELAEGDELEYDSTAYHMYHSLRPEWPCLSFDVIRDSLGTNRSRFPHTVFAVAGTQADRADNNRLQVRSDVGWTLISGFLLDTRTPNIENILDAGLPLSHVPQILTQTNLAPFQRTSRGWCR